MWIYILIGAIAMLLLLSLITAFVCFRMVFYSPKRKVLGEDEYDIPPGKIYEQYRDEMVGWMKQTRAMKHEDLEIKSFDGLTLRGKYYEYSPDAPIEIMLHGYKGNAERDLCGGVQRCFALGHSAIVVNQRASGSSEGSIISFGINERRDCLSWLEYGIERFGKEKKFILTGISMGAATVMLAAADVTPESVAFVLADCGYTSARDIIIKIMKEMRLPVWLLYPFVKLGARIFGGFDLEADSPIEAVSKAKVPVIFFHGDTDDFVPHDMSTKLFEACSSKKRFVSIRGAGHGLAFPCDKDGYVAALKEFSEECGL